MARSITTRSTNPKIMDDNIKILDDNIKILDEISEDILRGQIQVTADGVKTYGELLDEMFTLLDFDKVRNTTSFIFNDTLRDYISQIHFVRSGNNVQFTRVTITGSDPSYVPRIENIRLDATASSASELVGTTYTEKTNNVVPENNTLTLIY